MKPTEPTRLSVNVNKAALLRNSRPLNLPDVAHIARLAIDGGAQGITVHPRPDQRHIRASDVAPLRDLARARNVEYNIEGNPFHAYMAFARNLRPEQCTLVPDDPGASTSDHGWNLQRDGARLARVVAELKALGIRVSLFMDPEPEAMAQAAATGADRVELYTEPYARAFGTPEQSAVITRYREAAIAAREAGLGINAGHDLNRENLAEFIRGVPGVLEVSIGHALIADALEFGMAHSVRLYREAIADGATR